MTTVDDLLWSGRNEQIPPLDLDTIRNVIVNPMFGGGVFGRPDVGDRIWLAVFHEPGVRVWEFRIFHDSECIVSGSTIEPEYIVRGFARLARFSNPLAN